MQVHGIGVVGDRWPCLSSTKCSHYSVVHTHTCVKRRVWGLDGATTNTVKMWSCVREIKKRLPLGGRIWVITFDKDSQIWSMLTIGRVIKSENYDLDGRGEEKQNKWVHVYSLQQTAIKSRKSLSSKIWLMLKQHNLLFF